MDSLQKFYYKLWHKIGGRPWTEICRDVWVKYEWIPMTIFFFVGVAVGKNYGLKWAGLLWLAFTLGYIIGHFFWQDKFLYKRIDP